MDSILNCETSTGNRLLTNISKLFNNPKYSYLKIKTEEKYIYVHKLILQTNSSYFVEDFEERIEAMGEVKEHGIIEPKIQIEDYSYDVYYAFLKYIYTECIDIENEKSMDSLILANNYKDLKLKCIQLIKSSLTVENVCSLYCDSVDHQLEEMENIYFEFMKRRMKEISKTRGFIEMDDNSLKNFISKEEENNLFV